MNVFTVSLFGHREVDDLRLLGQHLEVAIRDLICEKSYVAFLVGRNGEFDEYAASVIKQVQKKIGKENSEITLVLPYTVADIEYYEKYYDGIIIPESVCGVHPKSAMKLRNKWIVEHSDLVIAYIKRNNGGAYEAVKYAKRINKKIINLS